MSRFDADFFESIVHPRPVGSPNNQALLNRLTGIAQEMNLDCTLLPFSCKLWTPGPAVFACEDAEIACFSGPFSPAYSGSGALCMVQSLAELQSADIEGKIVVLHGALAQEPIMPKGFPFYFPDEHQAFYAALEKKRPLAIISATGKHPMCGLNPFPLIEDGNFDIPSCYISARHLHQLSGGKHARLSIQSQVSPRESAQLVITKRAAVQQAQTVLICAHMDTAYNTPGALDNACGIVGMLRIMEAIAPLQTQVNFEFIPFNGEDYYEVSGQRAYLEKSPIETKDIKLVINIDDAGHIGSQNALSLYNIPEQTTALIRALVEHDPSTTLGAPWYAGDHSMFSYSGIPCLAFASSDLMETTIALTHTPKDDIEQVDVSLIAHMSDFTMRLLHALECF